ncbi:MAG: hypothetical protein AB1483_11680 [Candidatus Zixiibacteriota bacterium]
MEGFTFFRIIQAAIGLMLIAEYLRRTYGKKKERQRIHPVDGWFMLAGGVILLVLGVWGELPSLR